MAGLMPMARKCIAPLRPIPWRLSNIRDSRHQPQIRTVSSLGPNSTNTDLYKVLGVEPKASTAEIKAAYFKLSKRFHPDVNKSPDAVELFAHFSHAYEVLSNWKSRRQYDTQFFGRRAALASEEEKSGSVSEKPANELGVDDSARANQPHLSRHGHYREPSEVSYYTFDGHHDRTYRDLIYYRTSEVSYRKIVKQKHLIDEGKVLRQDMDGGLGASFFTALIIIAIVSTLFNRMYKEQQKRIRAKHENQYDKMMEEQNRRRAVKQANEAK